MDQKLITVINLNDIQQLYLEEGDKDKDYINYECRLTAKTEKLGKVMITTDKFHCAKMQILHKNLPAMIYVSFVRRTKK